MSAKKNFQDFLFEPARVSGRERSKWKWEFCCENVRCEIIIISRQEGERRQKKRNFFCLFNIHFSSFFTSHRLPISLDALLSPLPPLTVFVFIALACGVISRTIDFFLPVHAWDMRKRDVKREVYVLKIWIKENLSYTQWSMTMTTTTTTMMMMSRDYIILLLHDITSHPLPLPTSIPFSSISDPFLSAF